MSRIRADVAVQEQLAARGITETTGVYGDHKVQIGNGSPIRLDTIKSVRIPFAGFTRATQIERGKAGLQNSAEGVVRSLCERKGTLD
ncbi:MAG: hypothetical protein IJS50_00030, partial [Desulfovibrio sp.]|nr:hypothetical protein [Desulfovibrio sp.]